jgi:ubiquinone/menaquinone biosynthesis C-methylase UbiE
MTVKTAYNEWAKTYDADSNATRDLDQQVLQRAVGKTTFRSIIEFGCGTGKNTGLLARRGQEVHALDFSPGMIDVAREKHRRLSNVTFSTADITRRWPCQDRSADLVTCNLVLEHVERLGKVFSEAARVLAKDGYLFISELHPFRQYQGTVAKFMRGRRRTLIPAYVHHISDFLEAGRRCGFRLKELREWWHPKDEGEPPRLISFLFERGTIST